MDFIKRMVKHTNDNSNIYQKDRVFRREEHSRMTEEIISDFVSTVFVTCPEMHQADERKDSTDEKGKLRESVKDFCMDFHSILEKDYFKDVSIKCGSEVFRAHKVVLSARSPVFEAMFTNPLLETQTNTLVIDDIDPSTIRLMFTFIYSGQVKELSVSSASDLLYVAEKYQLKGLKKICVQYLMSNLSTQNVFKILVIADLYDKELKEEVTSFLHKNFSFLKYTDGWNEMQTNHPTLAMEVYSYVVDRYQNMKRADINYR